MKYAENLCGLNRLRVTSIIVGSALLDINVESGNTEKT